MVFRSNDRRRRRATSPSSLRSLLRATATLSLFAKAKATTTATTTDPAVSLEAACDGGFADQILERASVLALVVETTTTTKEKKEGSVATETVTAEIPDAYAVGATTTTTTIPFGEVFDADELRLAVAETSDGAVEMELSTPTRTDGFPRDCDGRSKRWRSVENGETARAILDAFVPSPVLQRFVDAASSSKELKNGVCLHRPNVEGRCRRENLSEAHCREQGDKPIGRLVRERLLASDAYDRTIYYVGDDDDDDRDVPRENLREHGFTKVLTRTDLFSESEERKLLRTLLGDEYDESMTRERYRTTYARLWSAVDFFVCRVAKSFVGNSLSDWSALQLLSRNGYGTWYNSRSIPLAETVRHAFPVPIVYTFTERSQSSGKLLLKTSVLSVRRRLGPSQPIHVLYHGHGDDEDGFVDWLESRRVVVHPHEPEWTDTVERLRLQGDPSTSHLFAHPGNYLGTWQRIDIPDLVETEYVLLLDADTVVHERFDMADLGPNVTDSVAFSLEGETDVVPFNAGVALMNVPRLRGTKRAFLRFIYEGEERAFSAPSDQGAYLDFYEPDWLDRSFNIKPYFNDMEEIRVIHFHGPKPNEILRYMMGLKISDLMLSVVHRTNKRESLCRTMIEFAKSASDDPEILPQYCAASFADDDATRSSCVVFFRTIASASSSSSSDLPIDCSNVALTLGAVKRLEAADVGTTTSANSETGRRRPWGLGFLSFSFLACCVVVVVVATIAVGRERRRRTTASLYSFWSRAETKANETFVKLYREKRY